MAGRPGVVAIATLAVFCAAGCSERSSGSSNLTNTSEATGSGLSAAAAAVEQAGSYRLVVEQSNLVLPRWGGSDGGEVLVDVEAGVAYARLFRTGDGPYEIVLSDGETAFKRETCATWARLQDAAGTLALFVVTPDELRRSSEIGGGEYDLEGVGRVQLEFDADGRPSVLRSKDLTGNGKDLEWRFEDWGTRVDAPKPGTNLRLSGPGGNPC